MFEQLIFLNVFLFFILINYGVACYSVYFSQNQDIASTDGKQSLNKFKVVSLTCRTVE